MVYVCLIAVSFGMVDVLLSFICVDICLFVCYTGGCCWLWYVVYGLDFLWLLFCGDL